MATSDHLDIERLRTEYTAREHRSSGKNLYSLSSKPALFTYQQRQRRILSSISNRFTDFADCKLLEVGCGGGGVLREFLSYGFRVSNIFGIDLLYNRLKFAHECAGEFSLGNANGQCLPFADKEFDLVIQFTAFSSILADKVKHDMASEMIRVVKDNGAILWYDFWLNPTNKQTKGIQPSEIKRLFPSCKIELHKITLAPPLARIVVPFSWPFAILLESLSIFNSHYLALIKPHPK